MKLIKSKVEILKQTKEIEGVYKQIEIAGRVCYKSEDKATSDSAKGFVDRMIKSGHGAMLEHGTVYLELPADSSRTPDYQNNKYSKVIMAKDNYAVTTNFRVLVENKWLDDLQYICEPTDVHEKRISVKFTCDRGVSHEFVRHRVFSFAQESQRYCNYSKDKFGNEITFICPSWFNNYKDTDVWDEECRLKDYLEDAEENYLSLINKGCTPQEARAVLPNATKTELVMTGTIKQWKEFFKLRCDKAAHPDAQYLAKDLLKQLYEQYPKELKEDYERVFK